MTYEELPHLYRAYAESREWEESTALAYWQQAAEYREYITAYTQGQMQGKLGEPEYWDLDLVLLAIRGKRGKIT